MAAKAKMPSTLDSAAYSASHFCLPLSRRNTSNTVTDRVKFGVG
jgi:hypothetical protein